MKTYLTEFQAIDKTDDGRLKKFAGPRIQAKKWEDAVAECEKKFPYLEVVGELIAEVDSDLSVFSIVIK